MNFSQLRERGGRQSRHLHISTTRSPIDALTLRQVSYGLSKAGEVALAQDNPSIRDERLHQAVLKRLGTKSQTARELTTHLRACGYPGITKSDLNKLLYGLLSSGLVSCHNAGSAPIWSVGSEDAQLTQTKPRVQKESVRSTFDFHSEVPVQMHLSNDVSSNDPYIAVDLYGTYISVQVNVAHPFFVQALNESRTREFALYTACVDALVLHRLVKLDQETAATSFLRIRDSALRLFNRPPSDTQT